MWGLKVKSGRVYSEKGHYYQITIDHFHSTITNILDPSVYSDSKMKKCTVFQRQKSIQKSEYLDKYPLLSKKLISYGSYRISYILKQSCTSFIFTLLSLKAEVFEWWLVWLFCKKGEKATHWVISIIIPFWEDVSDFLYFDLIS